MIHRLIPHPGLSALLVIVWMVMVNDVTFGTLFLGLVVGLLVPLFTAPWWPGRPHVRFLPASAYAQSTGTIDAESNGEIVVTYVNLTEAASPDSPMTTVPPSTTTSAAKNITGITKADS